MWIWMIHILLWTIITLNQYGHCLTKCTRTDWFMKERKSFHIVQDVVLVLHHMKLPKDMKILKLQQHMLNLKEKMQMNTSWHGLQLLGHCHQMFVWQYIQILTIFWQKKTEKKYILQKTKHTICWVTKAKTTL